MTTFEEANDSLCNCPESDRIYRKSWRKKARLENNDYGLATRMTTNGILHRLSDTDKLADDWVIEKE